MGEKGVILVQRTLYTPQKETRFVIFAGENYSTIIRSGIAKESTSELLKPYLDKGYKTCIVYYDFREDEPQLKPGRHLFRIREMQAQIAVHNADLRFVNLEGVVKWILETDYFKPRVIPSIVTRILSNTRAYSASDLIIAIAENGHKLIRGLYHFTNKTDNHLNPDENWELFAAGLLVASNIKQERREAALFKICNN